ncbi:hypothetical protein NDU88_004634 [Pleurodeles waltl]|uniref:CCHC-type domain-containing protein n=1 Tax=Pleurodeles waltl TaxID=8319 RepID=A0AAV7UH06_PLEWA|nr:hypothetical protein NDU88_004634 [Pleurodeles waltl]
MTKGQAEILQMAQYCESRYKEELEKNEKSVKELKKKVLLQQAYPQRDTTPQPRGGPPRGRGRGRGRGASAPPQDRQLNINQCAYCKQDGHWRDTCPLLEGRQSMSLNRGNAAGTARGRGREQFKECDKDTTAEDTGGKIVFFCLFNINSDVVNIDIGLFKGVGVSVTVDPGALAVGGEYEAIKAAIIAGDFVIDRVTVDDRGKWFNVKGDAGFLDIELLYLDYLDNKRLWHR